MGESDNIYIVTDSNDNSQYGHFDNSVAALIFIKWLRTNRSIDAHLEEFSIQQTSDEAIAEFIQNEKDDIEFDKVHGISQE